jgi:hypothetical protein
MQRAAVSRILLLDIFLKNGHGMPMGEKRSAEVKMKTIR